MNRFRRPLWSTIGTIGAILALATSLLLTACSSSARTTGATSGPHALASTSPTTGQSGAGWQLVWDQAAGDASDSPQAAYQASALARDPRGGLHAPAAAWWLATGPGFALALVQLDPFGQSVGFLVLARGTALGPNWSLVVASQIDRPAATTGHAFGPLPGGDYDCGSYNFDSMPRLSATLCLSPSRMFLYGRFTQTASRPMGVATVTVNGREGWLASADTIGYVNAVVVPLAEGGTYIFGGTAAGKQLMALAAEEEKPLLASGM